jgi:hypothetical protein
MPMPPSHSDTTPDLEAYAAVFNVLSRYGAGSLVSTHVTVTEIRQSLSHFCHVSDDELVGLIVRVATANRMVISFDHNKQRVA